MSKKYRLFVTEWAPNGTQTLFVVNDSSEIIETLEEALFGYNIGQPSHLACENNLIYDFSTRLAKQLLREQDDYSVAIKEITPELALKHIAVSPVTSDWQVIALLEKYGFKKEGAV